MTEVVKRNKALSVNPLKTSQTVGATLALLGVDRAIPLQHGSQGCAAFAKVLFVRHFREPIPVQTTAIDQVGAVMGGDEAVVEALATLCTKAAPALIGVVTTGLTEVEGCDLSLPLHEFRTRHPEFAATPVVPIVAPDFVGCLESGWAAAVTALIRTLVPDRGAEASDAAGRAAPPGPIPPGSPVTVLANAQLTPADLEAVCDLIADFDLVPVVVPDLSRSLDGHLDGPDYTPLSRGGTAVGAIRALGDAALTVVLGASLAPAADLLAARTGVPDLRFDHLVGLAATDRLVAELHRRTGRPVPGRVARDRARLLDALLDTHAIVGQTPVALAGDPDLVAGLCALIAEVGARPAAVVAAAGAPVLSRLAAPEVKIGDLEDLATRARAAGAALMIANSHAAATAEALGLPLLRAGIPQFDVVGAHHQLSVGYRGACRLLFALANLRLAAPPAAVAPYRSIYAAPAPASAPGTTSREETRHACATAA